MKIWDYLLENNELSSAKKYLRDINIYLNTVGKSEAKKATYQDILNYIGVLRRQHENSEYVKAILSALKKYYQYLAFIGVRSDNPARNIYLKEKRKAIQTQDFFSSEELECLMNRKERYEMLEVRNKVIISLLIYQGLSRESIVLLTLRDLNLEAGEIYIKSTNVTNSRTLYLRPNQILLFHRYLTEFRPLLIKGEFDALILTKLGTPETGEGILYLISTFQSLFRPRKLTPTTIRQSVITNLLKNNDLRIVQEFSGIRYGSSLVKYQSQEERMQDLIEKFHPLNGISGKG